MPRPNSTNYSEIARVAFDLWRNLGCAPENDKTPAARQRALLAYVECVKAVEGDHFDLVAIT